MRHNTILLMFLLLTSPVLAEEEPITKRFHSVAAHQGWTRALSFREDGVLASSGSDNAIHFWNPHTLKRLSTLHGHDDDG